MKQTIQLYADDGGTGDLLPIVFLHSTAGNASQWSAQLEHLRNERRVVALEWRGNVRAGNPTVGDYSFSAMAADVAGAVERLGIEGFAFVGHNVSGLVALQCAADHPAHVAELLVDPAEDIRRLPSEQTEPLRYREPGK